MTLHSRGRLRVRYLVFLFLVFVVVTLWSPYGRASGATTSYLAWKQQGVKSKPASSQAGSPSKVDPSKGWVAGTDEEVAIEEEIKEDAAVGRKSEVETTVPRKGKHETAYEWSKVEEPAPQWNHKDDTALQWDSKDDTTLPWTGKEEPGPLSGTTEEPAPILGAAEKTTLSLGMQEKAAPLWGAKEEPALPYGPQGKTAPLWGVKEETRVPLGTQENPAPLWGVKEEPALPLGTQEKATPLWGTKHKASLPWRNEDEPTLQNPIASPVPDLPAADSLALDITSPGAELVSLTTTTGAFIPIDFLEGRSTYNPNILPHPTKPDYWIVIVRLRWHDGDRRHEFVCEATMVGDQMICDPTVHELEIEYKEEGNCSAWMNRQEGNKGPRDARVFHGPQAPYIIFNSLAEHTCLGMWVQDARAVIQPLRSELPLTPILFPRVTELQRPPPYDLQEKNYFFFWDAEDNTYVHTDIWPRRVFARVEHDGSVSADLAPQAYDTDTQCLATHMPFLEVEDEHLHQATNALSITLCKRDDVDCHARGNNTFNMHIFHHNDIGYHIYDAYIMLFQSAPPFALHAISKKPLDVRGRIQRHVRDARASGLDRLPDKEKEFQYVTSMSWKSVMQKHHGYLDDVLFLAFGVHDRRPAAIDITAADLMHDFAYC